MRWKGGIDCNALGRSRGGVSTKIHALVDGKARPLHITLTAGHRNEALKADELVEHAQGKAFLADASYDTDRIRDALEAKKIKAVINNRGMRSPRKRVDKRLYRRRYLVECFFHRLKLFRAIATRYEKTARNYLSLLNLVCSWHWLN